MSKHTPGPWKAVNCGENNDTAAQVLIDGSNGLLADVSNWWVDPETARANARLIAAAPDMETETRRTIMSLCGWIAGIGLKGEEETIRAAMDKRCRTLVALLQRIESE